MIGLSTLPRRIAAVALLCIVHAAVGVWAGIEWQRGRDAISDRTVLQQQLADMGTAAADIRAAGLAQVLLQHGSAERMDSIANSYVETLHALDASFGAQRTAFGRYLATLRDRSDCRIGDVGLQWWTYYATGGAIAAPASAPGADLGGIEGVMSTGPADPNRRQPGGDRRNGGAGRADVPRLQAAPGEAGAGGDRL